MQIDSSTRLCCLIGHPVKHSISPIMHNAAFKKLKLNCIYLAFDVEPEDLGSAVNGLRSIKALGFNVTIPYKIDVMRFLDRLDDSAELVGSVNTVLIRNGELIGYNTDLHGIKASLEREDFIGDRAMILGAGGAARAALVSLLDLGFRDILIANRTLKRGEELAAKALGLGASRAKAISLDEARRCAGSCSLIINATPIGMAPDLIDETPLTSEEIPRDAVVLDLVYNPLKTRLLREAEKAGAKAVTGLEVLIHQGARAFKLWTGRSPPIDAMYHAALKALGGGRA